MRKDVLAGAAVGAALLGGAALYYFREKSTEEPEYRPLETDGDHQIRDYPALTVAETVVEGPRRDALDKGYRILADYLSARSREGEKLELTVPVMQDGGDPMASDPPLFDDDLEGAAWRTRFVMPAGEAPTSFPIRPKASSWSSFRRARWRWSASPGGRPTRLLQGAGRSPARLARQARREEQRRTRICLLQFADDPRSAAPQRSVAGAQLKL